MRDTLPALTGFLCAAKVWDSSLLSLHLQVLQQQIKIIQKCATQKKIKWTNRYLRRCRFKCNRYMLLVVAAVQKCNQKPFKLPNKHSSRNSLPHTHTHLRWCKRIKVNLCRKWQMPTHFQHKSPWKPQIWHCWGTPLIARQDKAAKQNEAACTGALTDRRLNEYFLVQAQSL